MPGRALIVGGSIAGLIVGNLLYRRGWDVHVFERASGDLSSRGAGLGTQPDLFRILGGVGIALERSALALVRSRICLGPDGRALHEVPIEAVTTSWDAIYRGLKNALPTERHHAGLAVQHVEQDANTARVVMSDGSHRAADLVVAADGLHSTVRRQLFPAIRPRYAGYVAWRASASEGDIPASVHELTFNHMVICFCGDGLILSVPMAHDDRGAQQRRSQFVWFRPTAPNALKRLLTDEMGEHHVLSIPPTLIAHSALDEMRDAAERAAAPQLAVLIRKARQPLLQPIYELEAPAMSVGRIALIGDAAFVARPHVGTGVTKAALDAEALVEAIARFPASTPEALAVYDRERKPGAASVVDRGRRLGQSVLELSVEQVGAEAQLTPTHLRLLQQMGAAGLR